MPRAVFYDPASPAAKAAAALVADQFDVTACTPGTPITGVVLTGVQGRTSADPGVRLIGVVDAGAPGPWPEAWYALVPAGGARPLVASAIANAFADLEAADQRGRLERDLDRKSSSLNSSRLCIWYATH